MDAASARRIGRGLAAYVRPTFLAPAAAMSLFGGALPGGVGGIDPIPAALHAAAVATALYVAHLVDGYVDGVVRGEEVPRLAAGELRIAAGATTALFGALAVGLWATTGTPAAALTVPLWLLAVLHAPLLDRHPLGVTADYPVGIGVAVVGGAAAQGSVPARAAAVAAAYALLLSGVKVSIDRLDAAFDRSVDKRTVPVVAGDRRARAASAALVGAAAPALAVLVAVGGLPPTALVAAPVAALAGACAFAPARRAARCQIGLTYPFTGLLALGTVPRLCAWAPLLRAGCGLP